MNLGFPSKEKHCKGNSQQIPQSSFFFFLFFCIFGQLNSKSVLSQRSINLPTRRSHSSRTKTRSYAHIKQTGPRLVCEPRLYTLPGFCWESFNCAISLMTVGTSAAASSLAPLCHSIDLTMESFLFIYWTAPGFEQTSSNVTETVSVID